MIVGVLLAGGKSSRFGSEKAVAAFDEGLLMDPPLAALDRVCDVVTVSAQAGSGAATVAQGRGYEVLADPPDAASGPLAGVLAALRWGIEKKADWLVTAPCDAAGLGPDQMQRLVDLANQSGCAAVASSEGLLEPLIAVWPAVRGLVRLEKAMAGGAHPPVRRVLAELGAVALDGFRPLNINTPA